MISVMLLLLASLVLLYLWVSTCKENDKLKRDVEELEAQLDRHQIWLNKSRDYSRRIMYGRNNQQ